MQIGNIDQNNNRSYKLDELPEGFRGFVSSSSLVVGADRRMYLFRHAEVSELAQSIISQVIEIVKVGQQIYVITEGILGKTERYPTFSLGTYETALESHNAGEFIPCYLARLVQGQFLGYLTIVDKFAGYLPEEAESRYVELMSPGESVFIDPQDIIVAPDGSTWILSNAQVNPTLMGRFVLRASMPDREISDVITQQGEVHYYTQGQKVLCIAYEDIAQHSFTAKAFDVLQEIQTRLVPVRIIIPIFHKFLWNFYRVGRGFTDYLPEELEAVNLSDLINFHQSFFGNYESPEFFIGIQSIRIDTSGRLYISATAEVSPVANTRDAYIKLTINQGYLEVQLTDHQFGIIESGRTLTAEDFAEADLIPAIRS